MPRRNPLANGLGVCRRAATGQLFQCCPSSACACCCTSMRVASSSAGRYRASSSDRIQGGQLLVLCALYRTGILQYEPTVCGNKGLLHVTEVGWDKTAGLFSLGDWAAL
ncbi:hypothetical protein V8C43DRAFT_266756, partial [Trichoderma afarasin]